MRPAPRSRGSAISSIPYMVRTRPAARVRSASAGKANAHHEPVSSASCVCASASTEPQVAPFVSPSAKRPRDNEARKSSVASATIAWIATKKAPAATRLAMLGTNSKNRIRTRLSPTAVADATKSVLRSASACARRTRASAGQLPRPIISIVARAVCCCFGTMPATTIASGSIGIARHTPVIPLTKASTRPPKAPAATPSATAIRRAMAVAPATSSSVKGAAFSTCVSTSSPWIVVPNGCDHDGGELRAREHRHDRPVARRDERPDDRGGEQEREQRDTQTGGAVGDERCQQSHPPARSGAEHGREIDLGGRDGHRLDPMSLATASRRCADRRASVLRAGRRRTLPCIPRPSATAPRSRARAAARRG